MRPRGGLSGTYGPRAGSARAAPGWSVTLPGIRGRRSRPGVGEGCAVLPTVLRGGGFVLLTLRRGVCRALVVPGAGGVVWLVRPWGTLFCLHSPRKGDDFEVRCLPHPRGSQQQCAMLCLLGDWSKQWGVHCHHPFFPRGSPLFSPPSNVTSQRVAQIWGVVVLAGEAAMLPGMDQYPGFRH